MKTSRPARRTAFGGKEKHLHNVGYQAALFTSNPNAGTISGLDRGVDVLSENGVEPPTPSTEKLHADFWKWRSEYPSEPYWVHFQTTDVHGPNNPPAPFAGLYVNPERRKLLKEWERRLDGLRRRDSRNLAAQMVSDVAARNYSHPDDFHLTGAHRGRATVQRPGVDDRHAADDS